MEEKKHLQTKSIQELMMDERNKRLKKEVVIDINYDKAEVVKVVDSPADTPACAPTPDPTPTPSILEAARDYVVNRKWSVIPMGKDKAPALQKGEIDTYRKRLANDEELVRWFKNADNQLGMTTGNISDHTFALDFDGPQWDKALELLLADFPELNNTLTSITGSGRMHLLGYCPEMPEDFTKTDTGKIPTDEFNDDGDKLSVSCIFPDEEPSNHPTVIELRCNNSPLMLPPSRNKNWGEYRFNDPTTPRVTFTLDKFNELKAWIIEFRQNSRAEQKQGSRKERKKTVYDNVPIRLIAEKFRSELKLDSIQYNHGANCPMGHGSEGGTCFSLDVQGNYWYCFDCQTGGDGLKLVSLMKDCSRAEAKVWLKVEFPDYFESEEDKETIDTQFHLTDMGNAENFTEIWGKDFCFLKEKGLWLTYDGLRWKEDEGSIIKKFVKTVRDKANKALNSFPKENDEQQQRKNIIKWCLQSESKVKIISALDLAAQGFLTTHMDTFDKDPWLLCCANGILDLRTGELKETSKDDRLLKSTGVVFDPEAKCPGWELFLTEIITDPLVIDWLQRAVGYSLTGSIIEHLLFILYGLGANGKSVFLAVLGELLGEYSQTAPFSVFKDVPFDAIPNDVARMAGARFVKSSEMKEGTRLNEERIKILTGGDKIAARFLHREWFEFDCKAKFWLGVNHKPGIRGTEEAIWRRVQLIPFDVTIPPERRDLNLKDKLIKELPGILNWALAGCLKYQKEGLAPVEKIRNATMDYRNDSDLVGRFIDEKCLQAGSEEIKNLYSAFCEWWKINEGDDEPWKMRTFKNKLRDKSFRTDEGGRGGGGRWKGICLR